MRVVREITLEGFSAARPGFTVGGEPVEITASVKELTVGEIRGWLKSSGAVSGDVVDCTLFEEFSLPDLCIMTSLKPADIDLLPPSELRRVEAVCQEVNADFFAMRNRVVQLGRQALAAS